MKKLRPSGGYRDTASFQTTTIIYDATVWFCEKFLDALMALRTAKSGKNAGQQFWGCTKYPDCKGPPPV